MKKLSKRFARHPATPFIAVVVIAMSLIGLMDNALVAIKLAAIVMLVCVPIIALTLPESDA